MRPWHTPSLQYCSHPLEARLWLLEASGVLGSSDEKGTATAGNRPGSDQLAGGEGELWP